MSDAAKEGTKTQYNQSVKFDQVEDNDWSCRRFGEYFKKLPQLVPKLVADYLSELSGEQEVQLQTIANELGVTIYTQGFETEIYKPKTKELATRTFPFS